MVNIVGRLSGLSEPLGQFFSLTT